eukprot:TRINITY_DN1528_c0_g1_i1.p1 TRINITY_DN1528_c0_g1~~TRINITY_DN1528_c0_g1_i1.p1  ORF type:complete len:718 (-),score=112.69 TRINITY_DN1528_c0_g1_i1:220-2301(-)
MSASEVKGKWTGASAFNLQLALAESRDWIERVIGEKFPSDDFQVSLKNGTFLCKLANQIKPGLIPKINPGKGDFAERENLAFFISACKKLGLKDTQVFEANDLFEAKRIRNVAIALYWLGRAARMVPTYKGPHLNLLAFKHMNCSACKKQIKDNNYLATLTQQWHPECARCHGCECPLNPKEEFYQQGDKMFCPNCMVGATSWPGGKGPGGKGAGKGPHGAGHGHEHCKGCHVDLDGKDYVPEGADKYCTSCICDLCHDPLLGPFQVTPDGKKICDKCNCFECGTPLRDGYYDDGPLKFCPPCYDRKNKEKPVVMKPMAHAPSQVPMKREDPGHGHAHGHPHDHGPGHGHGHSHPHMHPHTHSPKEKGCRECHKALDKKPKKNKGDRDQFCEPHENDFCCGKCDKIIDGPAVEALGKNWHPACFNCQNCHKDISKLGCPVKLDAAGAPWCQPCFDARAPACGGCSKPIRGKGVQALDKPWHPECLRCAKCKCDFPGGKYNEGEDGKPYCDKCINSWGPNDLCAGCNKGLHGQVTNVLGKFWHMGCFKCNRCKAEFARGYFPYQEMPYCKDCHHIVSGAEKCGVCSKALEGSCVTAQGQTWHKPCFKCASCACPLDKDTALTRFSKPYCKACHAKEKLQCSKCREVIKGAYAEDAGRTYCERCAPEKCSHYYGDFKQGWTIDPRSGKKTPRERA